MALMVIMDEETGKRLLTAFQDVLPGSVACVPSFALFDKTLGQLSRALYCVGPEIGRRMKNQGWRRGLIFAISGSEFEFTRRLIGPHDSLLFHDVPRHRLTAAISLAVAGLTVYPPELIPENRVAEPALEGFAKLTGNERSVLAGLAMGLGNADLAVRLGQTTASVRNSVQRICRALRCSNRVQAAVLAQCRFQTLLSLAEEFPPLAGEPPKVERA